MPPFRYPVPDNPPNEGDFVFIGFNQEWLPVILSVLQSINYVQAWQDPPDDILQQVEELIYLFQVNLDP